MQVTHACIKDQIKIVIIKRIEISRLIVIQLFIHRFDYQFINRKNLQIKICQLKF